MEVVEPRESREVLIAVVSSGEKNNETVEPGEVSVVKEEVLGNDVEVDKEVKEVEENIAKVKTVKKKTEVNFAVPFYSQFSDISKVGWQKVGCGIASLAMLIDFYSNEDVSVDGLLERGIASGAYLDNAGWIHSGLINLSKIYGLDGQSVSLADLNMTDAFGKFSKVVAEGPVMASVHYTFEPTNPIPHLVVITGVSDTEVFYNDPAEENGDGSLSIDKFQQAWKKRYIEIRPS